MLICTDGLCIQLEGELRGRVSQLRLRDLHVLPVAHQQGRQRSAEAVPADRSLLAALQSGNLWVALHQFPTNTMRKDGRHYALDLLLGPVGAGKCVQPLLDLHRPHIEREPLVPGRLDPVLDETLVGETSGSGGARQFVIDVVIDEIPERDRLQTGERIGRRAGRRAVSSVERVVGRKTLPQTDYDDDVNSSGMAPTSDVP